MANPILFTVAEVAERLKVSTDAVRALIHTGKLTASNVGSGTRRPRWRIAAEALDRFLAAQAAPRCATRRPRKRPVKVTEFF